MVTVRAYKSGSSFTAHEERPDGICEVRLVELAVEDFEGEISDELEEDFEGDFEFDETAPEAE